MAKRIRKISDINEIKAQIEQSAGNLRDVVVEKNPREVTEVFLSLENLPSKGKFYSSQLKIQPLKTMDVFILTNINNSNYISRYSDIFSRHVLGVDPLEILSIDEYYLLIWLRENAYPGYDYTSEPFMCSSCKKPSPPAKFKHDQFVFESNIDEIQGEYDDIELDSGREVRIYVRRRIHDVWVERLIEENYISIGQNVTDEEKKLLKFASVLKIPGASDLEERLLYLKEEFSPAEMVELLHKARGKTANCKIYAEVPCPHCGETNKAAFFFRTSIFLPTYQPKRIDEDAVGNIEGVE